MAAAILMTPIITPVGEFIHAVAMTMVHLGFLVLSVVMAAASVLL